MTGEGRVRMDYLPLLLSHAEGRFARCFRGYESACARRPGTPALLPGRYEYGVA